MRAWAARQEPNIYVESQTGSLAPDFDFHPVALKYALENFDEAFGTICFEFSQIVDH